MGFCTCRVQLSQFWHAPLFFRILTGIVRPAAFCVSEAYLHFVALYCISLYFFAFLRISLFLCPGRSREVPGGQPFFVSLRRLTNNSRTSISSTFPGNKEWLNREVPGGPGRFTKKQRMHYKEIKKQRMHYKETKEHHTA